MTIALPQVEASPAGGRYAGYAYAYPHKTAYRPLSPAVPLREAWAGEDKSALFLYVHVPFCEMRCGFCNLFTTATPHGDMMAAYVSTLEREAADAARALGVFGVAQGAIGGGTPTYLPTPLLDRVLTMMAKTLNAPLGKMPLSVETSPRTATAEKIGLLAERGVTRVSIGVQSFVEAEVAATGRAQSNALVTRAIETIRAAGIPTLNLDLIYGLPGQTVASFVASLEAALVFAPEELYLYPLYVRPLTGLARREASLAADLRAEIYTHARALLTSRGYVQHSMRMFRAAHAPQCDGAAGPMYCCQDDGMIGVGCGARSYTTRLHYSREFAVGREGVKAILREYLDLADFCHADYGVRLSADEQRRRYVIKSILRADGFLLADYRARFGSEAIDDLPVLAELIAGGRLAISGGRLVPTQVGLDESDCIGPALFSPAMTRAMSEYDLH